MIQTNFLYKNFQKDRKISKKDNFNSTTTNKQKKEISNP